MKIKIFKVLSILFAIILIISSLVACGTSDKMVLEEDRFAEESTNGVIAYSTSTKVRDNRKIIEYVDLSVQTKEFDTLIAGIEKEVAKLGGYIESSSISGNEYYSSSYRRANFTARIPTDKSSSFT